VSIFVLVFNSTVSPNKTRITYLSARGIFFSDVRPVYYKSVSIWFWAVHPSSSWGSLWSRTNCLCAFKTSVQRQNILVTSFPKAYLLVLYLPSLLILRALKHSLCVLW